MTERLQQASTYRIPGVDAARAVALLGMMAVHVLPRLDQDGDVSAAYLIAGGRSAALFAVLAGVGLALSSGGTRVPTGRRWTAAAVATTVRATALVTIGLMLGSMEGNRVAVILVYYGTMFVLAVPFLGLSVRALATMSVSVALVVPVLSHLIRDSLPEPWLNSPSPEWFTRPPAEAISELLLTGIYPALPWMAYIFAGMAVGRCQLTARLARWLLAGGAAVAVLAKVISQILLDAGGRDAIEAAGGDRFGRPLDIALDSGLFGVTPATTGWWLVVSAPHSATPLDLLGTIGSSFAVLGLMLLIVNDRSRWAIPLTSAGSMPLTLYSMHVVLLATVVTPDVAHSYLWHVVIVLGFAVWWQATVGRGPLEAGTRWLATSAVSLVLPGSTQRR